MSAYNTDFDKTNYVSLWIKDDKLLEKYPEIWEKVSNSIKKGFEIESIYNEKYLEAKKKSCK